MKKIGLILAGCLAFIGLYGAHAADDIGDAARVAVRRGSNTQSVSNRQKSDTTSVTSRPSGTKSTPTATRNATTIARTIGAVNRTQSTDSDSTNTVVRAATSVVTRPTTVSDTQRVTTRNATTNTSVARSAVTPSTRRVDRAAQTATREEILKRDFLKCRNVFYDCMDEFCANKDAQLKRCACSARASEFDGVKKQLQDIEDKMLDFNQRLLTVNMDREDAAALNIATDGENAFYETKDSSASKKTLDSIAKKLNTSFDSSNFSSSLGTVFSWSLDIDSAFDNVDSLQGASTVSKSGTALYSAALPICREMAAEVCSESDMVLAENGYQLTIEQDCNTVAKTYQSQMDKARNKVLESGALLDMSRLDVYQKRNSDDTLTCKKKMLTMLSDPTVCGENLGKCLDITGQYIDPTTGEAFLSADLSELNNLITRPTDSQSWTDISANKPFVSFLDSKKKFLEPAMENCQTIADTVWNGFLDDALAQIKIAQSKKLDEVRRSCTTLTAQCLTKSADSIIKFDSRALSTFGVDADTTQNAMCDNILSACGTLLETTGDANKEWLTGMTGIQTDITYETIKQTCRQVGQSCIIQVCTSTSGNFGLCENIDTSINRKSIINRDACWNEVVNCVKSAGNDIIGEIFAQNHLVNDESDDTMANDYVLYKTLYDDDMTITHNTGGSTTDYDIVNCISKDNKTCVYDGCWSECNGGYYADNDDCRACRLAENIWGNCEVSPVTPLIDKDEHNQIKIPTYAGATNASPTLLHWFAVNTGTANSIDSCRDTTCGPGFTASYDSTAGTVICIDSGEVDSFGNTCGVHERLDIYNNSDKTMCCMAPSKMDTKSNCCTASLVNNACVPDGAKQVINFGISAGNSYYNEPNEQHTLWCSGTLTGETTSDGKTLLTCSGRFIVTFGGHSVDPKYDGETQPTRYATESIPNTTLDDLSIHEFRNNSWGWFHNGEQTDTPQHWIISYE